MGLWSQADRDGRLEDRPMRLKAALFPYDSLDLETGLRRLTEAGLIIRYQVEDLRLIAIPTWSKHQQPHIREAVSELPAPAASTVLAPFKPVGSGKGREQEQEGVLPGVGLQSKSPSRGLQSSGDVLARFERFWVEYPRKTAKDDARKAFLKLAPDEALTNTMIAAVQRARASAQWLKDRGEFIPHGRTWIHGRRWEDEAERAPTPPHTGGSGGAGGCQHVTACATSQECYRKLRSPESHPVKAMAAS